MLDIALKGWRIIWYSFRFSLDRVGGSLLLAGSFMPLVFGVVREVLWHGILIVHMGILCSKDSAQKPAFNSGIRQRIIGQWVSPLSLISTHDRTRLLIRPNWGHSSLETFNNCYILVRP